jgi:hypothetical protein
MRNRTIQWLLFGFGVLLVPFLAACGGGSGSEADSGTGAGLAIATVTAVPTAAVTPTAVANAPETPDTPTSGRWIDVDLTKLEVQLMDGRTVVRTIGPVAVGEEIDTGAYESTRTGLFHVYVKTADLTYDPPYETYISDWVGFDPELANGFHSFLKDAQGNVVDPSTGRVSNGCIRSGEATVIYDFAEIGMPVLVHV